MKRLASLLTLAASVPRFCKRQSYTDNEDARKPTLKKRRKLRLHVLALALAAWIGTSAFPVAIAYAQTPARSPAPAQARVSAGAPTAQVQANLAQLMRGTLFPASNVVFAAQDQNPADVPPAKDPSTATNLLASSYGKWDAVENSALAMAEVANLLTLPGRKCSNGQDVPLKNADWAKLVQGLREAGITVYKAAQSKNQEKIVDAADTMTTACANCHDKYREKANLADRCK